MWGFALFNAVHLLIHGALLYWIARLISKRLPALPQVWRIARFAGIATALVAISFLPVYGVGHHE